MVKTVPCFPADLHTAAPPRPAQYSRISSEKFPHQSRYSITLQYINIYCLIPIALMNLQYIKCNGLDGPENYKLWLQLHSPHLHISSLLVDLAIWFETNNNLSNKKQTENKVLSEIIYFNLTWILFCHWKIRIEPFWFLG